MWQVNRPSTCVFEKVTWLIKKVMWLKSTCGWSIYLPRNGLEEDSSKPSRRKTISTDNSSSFSRVSSQRRTVQDAHFLKESSRVCTHLSSFIWLLARNIKIDAFCITPPKMPISSAPSACTFPFSCTFCLIWLYRWVCIFLFFLFVWWETWE